MEVAGRHRGRASGIQIMKTCELDAKDCKRDQTMMYLNSKIKFPLPHRVQRAPSKVSFPCQLHSVPYDQDCLESRSGCKGVFSRLSGPIHFTKATGIFAFTYRLRINTCCCYFLSAQLTARRTNCHSHLVLCLPVSMCAAQPHTIALKF